MPVQIAKSLLEMAAYGGTRDLEEFTSVLGEPNDKDPEWAKIWGRFDAAVSEVAREWGPPEFSGPGPRGGGALPPPLQPLPCGSALRLAAWTRDGIALAVMVTGHDSNSLCYLALAAAPRKLSDHEALDLAARPDITAVSADAAEADKLFNAAVSAGLSAGASEISFSPSRGASDQEWVIAVAYCVDGQTLPGPFTIPKACQKALFAKIRAMSTTQDPRGVWEAEECRLELRSGRRAVDFSVRFAAAEGGESCALRLL